MNPFLEAFCHFFLQHSLLSTNVSDGKLCRIRTQMGTLKHARGNEVQGNVHGPLFVFLRSEPRKEMPFNTTNDHKTEN